MRYLLEFVLGFLIISAGGSLGAREGRSQAVSAAAGTTGLLGDLQEHDRVLAAVSRCGCPGGQKVALTFSTAC